MFRTFFSAAALVSVVAAGLSFSSRTKACPMPMPQTLLWLYQNSREIHIARYSKTEDVAVVSEHEDASEVTVRLYFEVSTTLKGETKKLVTVDEVDYRSKRQEEPETSTEDESEEPEEAEEPAESEELDAVTDEEEPEFEEEYTGWRVSGETVLVFLTERSDDDEDEGADTEQSKTRADRKDEKPIMVLTSQRDGVRHISTDDIGVYGARIKELNSIYSGDAESRNKELVEWMIRCMEHRATLWDGAYELNSSFESLDRIENAAEHKGPDDDKPWVAPSDEEDAAFARLVSNTQMDRISNLLMSPPDVPKSSIPAFMRDGESALISLVERWAGADVARFLLQRLRNSRLQPWENRRLMGSIATMLGGEELSKAVAAYGEVSWGDDNDFFEEEEDKKDSAAKDPMEQTETVAKRPDKPSNNEPSQVAESEVKKKPQRTVLEVRAERLAAFLALAESVMASPEVQIELANKATAAGKDR